MFAHRALLTACCARLVAAKLRHEPAHASEAPFDPPLPLPIPTQAMHGDYDIYVHSTDIHDNWRRAHPGHPGHGERLRCEAAGTLLSA